SFIKASPFIDDNWTNQELFRKLKFKKAPIHVLAETLWLLDINKSEDELLANMRKTTRNLIRKAIKENVKITRSNQLADLETFLKLHQLTVKRHNFTPYTDQYFKEQVKAFQAEGQVMIFNASHQGKPLASAVIMFYGEMAFYHHGASVMSKIPASHLIQWAAIKEAQKRNCRFYNFWGIYEGRKKNHPFAGISLFKKGFGGRQKQLLPCQDLPLNKKYFINYFIESVRRIKRGF
ncbi:MAG TPA: peptidoglycan bridge formation glycyltransferase FemA/FemB family protein, partial [Patescibacteria group bacterium]